MIRPALAHAKGLFALPIKFKTREHASVRENACLSRLAIVGNSGTSINVDVSGLTSAQNMIALTTENDSSRLYFNHLK
jgi:hypothetical protein